MNINAVSYNEPKIVRSYPLLPFQQLMYDIMVFSPKVSMDSLTLRVNGISKLRAIEVINNVLSHHGIFRMRIDKAGRQYCSDCTDLLEGPYHRVKLTEREGYLYITINFNLIFGDETSLRILLNEIIEEYYVKSELRNDGYWEYLKSLEEHKLSEHYHTSKSWLLQEFMDNKVPLRPKTDYLFTKVIISSKVDEYIEDYSCIYESIRQFCVLYHLTLEGFFAMCTSLAISQYCGTDESALTWLYIGRNKQCEENIYGHINKDIPFRLKMSDDRKELVRMSRNQIRLGIAHSDYPFTLTEPYNQRWNYAVNIYRTVNIAELFKQLPLDIEISDISKRNGYALLDVEIHDSSQSLSLAFRYSTLHYKRKSITNFSLLIRKNILWFLELIS